jgi:peptidoglycan/xylan/chitin deacetylase (PgdA/CDA1 family)
VEGLSVQDADPAEDGGDVKYTFISAILSTIPPSLWFSLIRTNPVIVYYHMVSDGDVAHVRHLYPYKNVRQFRSDIDFIAKHYTPVTLGEMIAHVKNGGPLPARALMMSFDDGFREHHDVIAPILLEKGVPATFFVNSGFVDNRALCFLQKASILVEKLERSRGHFFRAAVLDGTPLAGKSGDEVRDNLLSIPYESKEILDTVAQRLEVDFDAYLREHRPYLTTAQIKTLLRHGFSIGAHSIDHPLYSSLHLDEQVRQTVESLRFVRETFSLTYGAFAFPHKDYGISREFFCSLQDTGLVDVSFGTAGMIPDDIRGNLQRFSMEIPPLPADRIVALECARKLRRIAKGVDRIERR